MCVCVVDLHAGGNYYQIQQVTVSDAGLYECFVDNGVKPTTLARMRVDVMCKFMLLLSICLPLFSWKILFMMSLNSYSVVWCCNACTKLYTIQNYTLKLCCLTHLVFGRLFL